MTDISEQVSEAAHHAMKAQLQRHQRSEDNQVHGEMQLKAVSKFGSWNVFNMIGTKKQQRKIKQNEEIMKKTSLFVLAH